MSELDEFKKVVSPIAYGLAYKSELGTTEYQQLYAEEDVIKYFNNKPQLTIPKRIVEILGKYDGYNPTADKLIMMAYRDYQEFHDWIIKDWVKNDNIARAYLAGKALGVDLVKVVEGIDDNY
ncbi:hypothetical protein [Lactococcus lactis]|uniref:hypothetical protein n=1 Tax=Lactococcus lactis TaxID=1358 RepID=UPI0025A2256A|nr:hypothetical protein [Lactococcus lactis]MDM7534311.1 hypothetical protein [Lactococcus lactis]